MTTLRVPKKQRYTKKSISMHIRKTSLEKSESSQRVGETLTVKTADQTIQGTILTWKECHNELCAIPDTVFVHITIKVPT